MKSLQDTMEYYICRKKFLKKLTKSKNHGKVRDHYYYTSKYRGATYSICNLRFNLPRKILVVLHIGSN